MAHPFTHCRACQTELPTDPVFSLGDMEVVSFPETADAPQLVAPLNLVECSKCELVQLTHSVDADSLFRRFWYRSATTRSMRAALQDVIDSALRFVELDAGDGVLDIGTNDGTLLELYPSKLLRVGFEPAEALAKEAQSKGLTIVPDYFGQRFIPTVWRHRFKIVTAIAMFYDLDDPGEFLEAVKLVMHPEGIFIVQMNGLEVMLRNRAVDNICHEHVAYYSARAFCKLLAAHKLSLVAVEENDVNGGSLRFYVRLSGETPIGVEAAMETRERPVWDKFRADLQEMKSKILTYIETARAKARTVGILGASTRGLTLLHYLGLTAEHLSVAAERDSAKWRRFYGATGIPIVSETVARKTVDVFLVLPWHFEREIVDREQEFLKRGGELIFPLPRPKVKRYEQTEFL